MTQNCFHEVSKIFAIAVRGTNKIRTVFVKNDHISSVEQNSRSNNYVQENAYLFPFECTTLEKNEDQGSTTQAQSNKVTTFSMFHFEVI